MQFPKKIMCIVLLLLSSVIYAQTTPSVPNPPPPGEPIDNLIIVLFLLAIGYGMYNIKVKHQSSKK